MKNSLIACLLLVALPLRPSRMNCLPRGGRWRMVSNWGRHPDQSNRHAIRSGSQYLRCDTARLWRTIASRSPLHTRRSITCASRSRFDSSRLRTPIASSSQALVNARCAVLRTFWLTGTFANSITTRTFQVEHGAAELSTSATVPTQRSWTGATLDQRIFEALASINPLNCWPSWRPSTTSLQ